MGWEKWLQDLITNPPNTTGVIAGLVIGKLYLNPAKGYYSRAFKDFSRAAIDRESRIAALNDQLVKCQDRNAKLHEQMFGKTKTKAKP